MEADAASYTGTTSEGFATCLMSITVLPEPNIRYMRPRRIGMDPIGKHSEEYNKKWPLDSSGLWYADSQEFGIRCLNQIRASWLLCSGCSPDSVLQC